MRRVPVPALAIGIAYLALVGGFELTRRVELADHPQIVYYPSLPEAARAFLQSLPTSL